MNQIDLNQIWDCLMIGAGPTALASAVYTAREDIKTLVLEKNVVGGLAAITEKVDNYPGFAVGVSGLELAEQLQKQAERFGAVIEYNQVVDLKKVNHLFEVLTADDQIYRSRSVLIATGSQWKQLQIEGEDEYYGQGIHNCATCDGAFYRGKKLVVVGGGNSAAQESLFLTKFASHIDILIRKSDFKASPVLVKKVINHPKIQVHFLTKPLKFLGQQKLQKVEVDKRGIIEQIETDGVFVFIGLKPVTDFLQSLKVNLDEAGFILTNNNFQTNIDGLFCAGDVRSGATMQIASAVGEGASTALAIRYYLEKAE
ncbi:MAG: FAD-dependent oxidoreductase [Candidatus Saccharibacteria bacterium]|nr:FAD-dependent oxidoreductase [Candidatus Saccharibacteria bacterium]